MARAVMDFPEPDSPTSPMHHRFRDQMIGKYQIQIDHIQHIPSLLSSLCVLFPESVRQQAEAEHHEHKEQSRKQGGARRGE